MNRKIVYFLKNSLHLKTGIILKKGTVFFESNHKEKDKVGVYTTLVNSNLNSRVFKIKKNDLIEFDRSDCEDVEFSVVTEERLLKKE